MVKLQPTTFWYIIFLFHLICINHVNCGITSYIGSLFGYGKTDTTTTLPKITTTTTTTEKIEVSNQLDVLTSQLDNTKESSQFYGQYVPIVYYIPVENLYQQNEVPEIQPISIIPNDFTSQALKSENYQYMPWYHIVPTGQIPNLNEYIAGVTQFNNDLDTRITKTPANEVNQLPNELRELADKLGLKEISNLPSLSEMQELLGLSTQQETIDFILDLASTDYGLSLIKSYMIEEDSIPNLDDSNFNSFDSRNDELNEIESDLMLFSKNQNDDMAASESNIMSVVSKKQNHENPIEMDHSEISDKVVVRRENNDLPLRVSKENKFKATYKRAQVNMDIIKRVIAHPFRTGFFGTLKHWSGFFTKNPILPNEQVPIAYTPTPITPFQLGQTDHIAEGTDKTEQIIIPENNQEFHYVQYPDGQTYMINPILYDYLHQYQHIDSLRSSELENTSDDPKKEEHDVETNEKNQNLLKDDSRNHNLEGSLIEKDQSNIKAKKDTVVELLEDSFRKYDEEIQDDITNEEIEAEPSFKHEEVTNTTNPQTVDIATTKLNEVTVSESPVETETTENDSESRLTDTTTEFIATTVKSNSADENEKFEHDQDHEESGIQIVTINPPKIENFNNEQEESMDKFKFLDNEEISISTTTDISSTINHKNDEVLSPVENIPLVSSKNEKYEEILDSVSKLRQISAKNDLKYEEVFNSDTATKPTIKTTERVTYLKPISEVFATEWKPQRVSGVRSFATGKLYRADPLNIVIPKMIVPNLSN